MKPRQEILLSGLFFAFYPQFWRKKEKKHLPFFFQNAI
jgi:hypothetical protein